MTTLDLKTEGAKAPKVKRQFTPQVRKNIVKEIDDKVYTVSQAAELYGVARPTLYKWLNLYSLHWQKQIVQVVQHESELYKTKLLAAELLSTQRCLATKTVENTFLNELVAVISEEYKIDFKKNINQQLLPDFKKHHTKETTAP